MKEQSRQLLKIGNYFHHVSVTIKLRISNLNSSLFFSYVHAAYASFLWEIDGEEDQEEEEEDEEGYYSKNKSPIFNNGTMASATA